MLWPHFLKDPKVKMTAVTNQYLQIVMPLYRVRLWSLFCLRHAGLHSLSRSRRTLTDTTPLLE